MVKKKLRYVEKVSAALTAILAGMKGETIPTASYRYTLYIYIYKTTELTGEEE